MMRQRNILLAVLSGAGFLLALLVALFLLAPRLINTTVVKERGLALLERETGVRLSYARAEVTLFPRPRVALRGVGLDVPGLAQGTAAALEADPELLPLLRGVVRMDTVRLDSPDFRVPCRRRRRRRSRFPSRRSRRGSPHSSSRCRGGCPGRSSRSGTPGWNCPTGKDRSYPCATFRRIALPPDRLTVHVRCSSEYWEGLSIETSVRTEGLRAETRVETAGFRVRDLAGRLSMLATTSEARIVLRPAGPTTGEFIDGRSGERLGTTAWSGGAGAAWELPVPSPRDLVLLTLRPLP